MIMSTRYMVLDFWTKAINLSCFMFGLSCVKNIFFWPNLSFPFLHCPLKIPWIELNNQIPCIIHSLLHIMVNPWRPTYDILLQAYVMNLKPLYEGCNLSSTAREQTRTRKRSNSFINARFNSKWITSSSSNTIIH